MIEGTENDVTNLSTSSSHRLPTISASEALQNAARKSKAVHTSLPSLDAALPPVSLLATSTGGVQKGQLTEVYGPPGVGKTALGIQLVVNTISSFNAQNGVVWIDTGAPLVSSRVLQMMKAYKVPKGTEIPSSPPEPRNLNQLLERITNLHITSLPHILTLFLHPPTTFPPPQTALVVVDDLSRLLLNTLPGSAQVRKGAAANVSVKLREKLAKKAAQRKWSIISELASAMSRMAAIHDLAVVVLNQTATSLSEGHKAALRSALSAGQGWNAAVGTRILLYRDFLPADLVRLVPVQIAKRLRLVEVEKVGGKEVEEPDSIMFYITNGGLRELNRAMIAQRTDSHLLTTTPLDQVGNDVRPSKRKADEIADSEDEADGGRGAEDTDSLGHEAGVLVEGDPVDEDAEKVERMFAEQGESASDDDEDDADGGVDEERSEPEATPFQNLSSDAELTQDDEYE